MVPLGAVFVDLIHRGAHLFGWAFVTKPIPTPRETGPGMGPAVVGTIIITLWATIIAVPLGVLGRRVRGRVRRPATGCRGSSAS